MKISDFAAHSGLTPDTVRYYERIGLLPRSVRDAGGRRSYGMADIGWASFLRKLQAMGMPMRDRLKYSRLRTEGPATTVARREMLEAHRAGLAARVAELTGLITALDDKIDLYRTMETAIGGQNDDYRPPSDDDSGDRAALEHDTLDTGADHAG
ncbi:MerR family transcriptional regulator [Sphingomonas aliaeris]|uniref:MerR family transcriptional regulator n=1 Tax=Sphingomonas aliaeris TaxID=2759526 RepID=A0A974NSL1_9SPHN|nr:MerR family transcriptional regulator [Sphingomonas aliaeris]QQV76187.1 MerR family transcriptional regulator [Sphingomonas aliaeris]